MGAVIGEVKRTGRWRIRDNTHVVMGIGDCHLDLRTAELDGDEVTVTISQIIGDTTIVVPQHVDVELSGFFLIGDKSLAGSEEELPPAAPRVHVRAFGLIGELNVVRR
jgi:predicted membrane protein